MEGFSTSRLRLARMRSGITVAELARRTGLSRRGLTSYESGDRTPDSNTIESLARVLQVDPRYFQLADVEPVPIQAASFRSLSRTPAYSRNRALASIHDAEGLIGWFSERYQLPELDLPDLTDIDDPEVAADALRAEWGLGSAPAPDMVNLLEHHGLRVFSLRRAFDDVDAFCVWRNNVPFVFLSLTKSGERGRFDAAHELAHASRHASHPTGRDEETDANRFASAFLMPATDVVAHVRAGAQIPQILAVKGRWRVAATALTRRLHDLDLLTDWQYHSLLVQLSQMGFRSSEPGGIPRERSDLFAALFADARRRHGATAASIAAELALTANDVRQLTFESTITAVG